MDPGVHPTKFSRYRSVRKATSPPTPVDAPAVPALDDSTANVNRAPSRYHRANRLRGQTLPSRQVPNQSTKESEGQPLSPVAQDSRVANAATTRRPAATQHVKPNSPSRQNVDHEFSGGPVQSSQSPNLSHQNHARRSSGETSKITRAATTTTSPKSYEAAREEARMILEGEYDRLQKLKDAQTKVEQKVVAEVPRPNGHPAQTQASKPEPVYFDAPKLNVKRKVEKRLPERYHDAPQPMRQRLQSPDQPVKALPTAETKIKTQTPSKPQQPIEPARLPVQRQFDAPISAVNAGDRRVEVRFGNADRGITLPVTPTTNSKDLLNSASIVMSEDFNPRTSILVESFSNLGLERPLRRYEHIRDVMNSWDTDDQNHLVIMTESECQAKGLDQDEAPVNPSERHMVQMYLSQRPGKWEKKWIILRPDGQVTMSKYENDGDATNICHLSDYDVYTPTHKQKKKLRPPKKICFAVKSQQKSAMFLEGSNFAHFFATNDKQAADQWYGVVQSWRSWYLVHVLGEGAQKNKEIATIGINQGAATTRPVTAHSTESIPYQLGSFQPLLDLGELTFSGANADSTPKPSGIPKKPSVDLGIGKKSIDLGRSATIQRASRHHKGGPPSSFPSKLLSDVDDGGRTSLDNSDQAFTGGGLLGRNLSTRKSQGAKSAGQATGASPGKPLVDLAPTSEFAEGSLLRKLEAWSATQGEHELKIDRQKRVEADVKVGEGLY